MDNSELIEVLESEISDLETELSELELDLESEEDEGWQKRLKNMRTQLKYRLKAQRERLTSLQEKQEPENQQPAQEPENEPAQPERKERVRLFRKRR